ncbi:MAG: restriction endonuclease subunit S [Halobacteriota archaeon]
MNWHKLTFKTFITLQRGFDLPVSEMKDGEVPVFGSTGIIGFHNKAKANPPGVVTGRSGTIGVIQFTDKPYWPHNTSLWVKDFKSNHPKFVYYKMKTLNLDLFNGGASVPTLNRNNLDNIIVQIPDISVQEKIADILSAYDDLIDTNRRRIQLLEESARLLFREWFVCFRFPGHEKVKIVDGMPEGWEKGLLEDIATVKKGKNITFELAIEGDIPVVGGGLEPTYYHNKANVSAPVITISASGANAGYVNMYDTDIWASDCSYIDKNSTKYIYSLYLRLKSLQTAIFGFQVGVAQPHVYPRDINRLRLLIAPDDLCVQFEQLVAPIFNLIKNLKWENQKLAQARDLLLPRLMNGAIEV